MHNQNYVLMSHGSFLNAQSRAGVFAVKYRGMSMSTLVKRGLEMLLFHILCTADCLPMSVASLTLPTVVEPTRRARVWPNLILSMRLCSPVPMADLPELWALKWALSMHPVKAEGLKAQKRK